MADISGIAGSPGATARSLKELGTSSSCTGAPKLPHKTSTLVMGDSSALAVTNTVKAVSKIDHIWGLEDRSGRLDDTSSGAFG